MGVLVVFQALMCDNKDPSPFGLIITDCKALVPLFANVEISFMQRSTNKPAHALACEACSLFGVQVWG
ncbi:conserved hypothetical protein [Ricinus communis]|uniref:RNase H type-1 domain-containing protein n=1 Tax=Ricinus communis TaxID=3988 RepID=B9S3S1_RICCO|nr:conserved hypothetical protein [Ricinus communis]